MTSVFDVITIFLIFAICLYAYQIFRWSYGVHALPVIQNPKLFTVEVLVAARNEELTIADCLDSLLVQEYPMEKFHITVIDDHSDDGTRTIIEHYVQQYPSRITLLIADVRNETISPKMNALRTGLKKSTAEIIATTDADCVVHRQWIQQLIQCFDEETGIVTGPVFYQDSKSISALLFGIQHIDYISHTAVCAGSIGIGRVNSAIGCNMAFRRQAFDDVNGFTSFIHFNSGYDSLLAQKIVEHTNWKARFIPSQAGSIITHPVTTWFAYLNQRARWSAQTSEYRLTMMSFMIITFVMYVLLTILLPIGFVYDYYLPYSIFIIKAICDLILLYSYTEKYSMRTALKYFPHAVFIHIPFTIAALLLGYFSAYSWKNRKLGRIQGNKQEL